MWASQALTALAAIGVVVALSVPTTTMLVSAGHLAPTLVEEVEAAGPDDTGTVEQAAIDLADALGIVQIAPGEPCLRDWLAVSWVAPGPEYTHGAFIEPVGPPPGPTELSTNGVVFCEVSTFSFMGFQAHRTTAGWSVLPVPEPDEHTGHRDLPTVVPDAVHPFDVPVGHMWDGRWGPEIEGYAAYVPQRVCHPSPKPGVHGFARLVLRTYPESRNYGIGRACEIGGLSEHKEGRAWDWGVHVSVPGERLAADEVVSWLMATDQYGNRHAMARRLGVMYIIWNEAIWTASRAHEGWRPYVGPSPHTDHVHLSFSIDGALGRTSFWAAFPDGIPLMANPFAGTPSAFPEHFIEQARTRQDEAHAEDERALDDPAPDESPDEEGPAPPAPDEEDPTLDVDLPDVDLPDADLPDADLPDADLPDVPLPTPTPVPDPDLDVLDELLDSVLRP